MTSATVTGWSQILDSGTAARAAASVAGIVRALDARSRTSGGNVSLASGACGLALLSDYLDGSDSGVTEMPSADDLLSDAADAVARTPLSPGLYSGFTGVAWTFEHLARDVDGADDDPNADVDRALLDWVIHGRLTDDYDLVSGLVGVGVYALERCPRRSGRELLGGIVRRLEGSAHRNDRRATWFTPPERLPAWQRELWPVGHYNLGVAHGVPGVIALLGGACRVGVDAHIARPLLDDAVRWLLAQKLPAGSPSVFPTCVGPDIAAEPARAAWCYGDPGIATALLVAAQAVGSDEWLREAIDIAHHAADRPIDQSGVRDGGLCHGAAGLAHIYNRLFHATGDERFRDAARLWFGQTLDMARPGEGRAGYTPYRPPGTAVGPDEESGLLEGTTGIALALAAALTDRAPAWDRMLLVSSVAPSEERAVTS